jgi:PAS domain S-box-containing protein
VPSLIHTARPDGYLDYFNQSRLQYVGLPIEEMLGWKWMAVIHPEDVQALVDQWRASVASEEALLHEARVRRADGQYRWMLHHKVAVRGERGEIVKWYGSSLDIEDRKRAEDKIGDQGLELRQMLDLTPQLVAVFGPNRERLSKRSKPNPVPSQRYPSGVWAIS